MFGRLFLYAQIIFGKILRAVFGICTDDTSFKYSMIIGKELRKLKVVSLLRYLPSIEIVSDNLIHWKQTLARIRASIYLDNGLCIRACCVPMYIFQALAPLLSILAMLVKMEQVHTRFPYSTWEHWIVVIGFINQVSGLRILRTIESKVCKIHITVHAIISFVIFRLFNILCLVETMRVWISRN